MTNGQRVVITGMGWVTPLGHDLETVWQRLIGGVSGVTRIERFRAATFPTNFAAQVRDYDYKKYVRNVDAHNHAGTHTQFALGAARQAWDQARLRLADAVDPRRVGIYLGAGEGMLDFDSYASVDLLSWDEQAGAIDPVRWLPHAIRLLDCWREIEQEPNMPLSHIAHEFGIRGPAYNCLTACAASTQAVGEACGIIRRGDADVMVAGGAHTMLHVLGITGFSRLNALSTDNDNPTKASRPFDRTRGGFVLGEGAGIVILESLAHALGRGAAPLAEIAGYGASADAFRITDMDPDGSGPAAAMQGALAQAGVDPQRTDATGRPPVQYISAHGTGTKENDSIETKAIKSVFGPNADRIPISSIKSMLGHLIAAAGVVELITCVLAMARGMVPPTINLDHPDPELGLDYVPNRARKVDVDTCLSNSFGFGGQNAALLVRRYVP
jgi:3-oxoacyl-[acyl-carrier-protein] synthase II